VIGRIHESAAFLRTRENGTRVRSSLVWCTMLLDPTLRRPHVGYAIGRSVGNAVTRNRARRRLRAALHDRGADLRPGWYVLGASPELANCSPARVRREVDTLVSKLARVSGVEPTVAP
jgi:ribonuclease P protein component